MLIALPTLRARSVGIGCLISCLGLTDAALPAKTRRGEPAVTACEGARPTPPSALFFQLRSGAFPGGDHPDVAVHLPPGFDATRSPGAVLYFHGWNGCVAAALSDDDVPCEDGGEPRAASALASQLDEARVNAMLVAVELRIDAATGETGELAGPGTMRAILGEVLGERLPTWLGCALEVDALERIVVVAHSGGYQAAASVLEFGDLPRIGEVVLLDAFYGADEVFGRWLDDALSGEAPSRRFVDLYTCCGGTLARSRAMGEIARTRAWGEELVRNDDDDRGGELDSRDLDRAITFKRVGAPHGALPRRYMRAVLESSGFSAIGH